MLPGTVPPYQWYAPVPLPTMSDTYQTLPIQRNHTVYDICQVHLPHIRLKVARTRTAVTSGLMLLRHPLLILVWPMDQTQGDENSHDEQVDVSKSTIFPVQFCRFLSKHRLVLNCRFGILYFRVTNITEFALYCSFYSLATLFYGWHQ